MNIKSESTPLLWIIHDCLWLVQMAKEFLPRKCCAFLSLINDLLGFLPIFCSFLKQCWFWTKTDNHCFSHVYVPGLYILTITYGLWQKSKCIILHLQVHKQCILVQSWDPLCFGGAHSSCCNLGGCTDPVLLIHCFHGLLPRAGCKEEQQSSQNPKFGATEESGWMAFYDQGASFVVKSNFVMRVTMKPRTSSFQVQMSPTHREQIYTTLFNTYNNY